MATEASGRGRGSTRDPSAWRDYGVVGYVRHGYGRREYRLVPMSAGSTRWVMVQTHKSALEHATGRDVAEAVHWYSARYWRHGLRGSPLVTPHMRDPEIGALAGDAEYMLAMLP